MSKMKTFIEAYEKHKKKVALVLILLTLIIFYISTVMLILKYDDTKMTEYLINVYCIAITALIGIHELASCLVCVQIIKNFALVTHHTGKGILFILVSFLYLPPVHGLQQNISAFVMLTVGVLLILLDIDTKPKEKSPFEIALDNAKKKNDALETKGNLNSNNGQYDASISVNGIQEELAPKKSNPYDIPEDF